MSHDQKFQCLIAAIREARAQGADAIVAPSPEALGDNYAELVRNLGKIAEAGLALQIVPEGRDMRSGRAERN